MTDVLPRSYSDEGLWHNDTSVTDELSSTPSDLETYVRQAKRLFRNAYYKFGSDRPNIVWGVQCDQPSGKLLFLSLSEDDEVDVHELSPYDSNEAISLKLDIPCDAAAPAIEFEQSSNYLVELKSVMLDRSVPLSDRAAAAMKVALIEPESVRSWTLEQLAASTMDTEAATNLIYLADELRFPSVDERDRLWRGLMNHALSLKSQNAPELEGAIGTAIRRIASVIPEFQADELLKFLEQDSGADTRLIALQAVCVVFSMEPYTGSDLASLKVRVNELRRKLIDRDVLVDGQVAALASAAIAASACLDFSSIDDILAVVKDVQPWFQDIVKRSLIELADNWDSSSCKSAVLLKKKVAQFAD